MKNYYITHLGIALSILFILTGCDNTPPVALDAAFITEKDSSLTDALNASDTDKDALKFKIVKPGNLGTVTISNASVGQFTYVPNKDTTGNDQFSYEASDGKKSSNKATVTIQINNRAIGVLDTSLNADGHFIKSQTLPELNNSFAGDIIVDNEKRILVTGWIEKEGNEDMVIWRFNDDGSMDTTFNGQGMVVHDGAAGKSAADRGNALSLDREERILVAGYSTNSNGNYDMTVWRYTAEGKLDTQFAGSGFISHDNASGGNGYDRADSITVDTYDRILVTGSSANPKNLDITVWRLLQNGQLDATFNKTGYVVFDGGGDDRAFSVTVDDTNRILVAGKSFTKDDDALVLCYLEDGNLDKSFGLNGVFIHDGAAGASGHDVARALAIDSKSRILVAGKSFNGNDFDMTVWRLTRNGSLDTNFNSRGYLSHHASAGGNGTDSAWAVTVVGNNHVLVAGSSENAQNNLDLTIWRIKNNGKLDPGFNQQGFVSHDGAVGGARLDAATAIVLDKDYQILISGYRENENRRDMAVWRFK